jgi:hypothetical protein
VAAPDDGNDGGRTAWADVSVVPVTFLSKGKPMPPADPPDPSSRPDDGMSRPDGGPPSPQPRTPQPPPPTPQGAQPPPPTPQGAQPPPPTPARPTAPTTWPTAGGGGAPVGGALLPIRPLSVGDILDGSFKALRATIGPVALLVVTLLGPVQLLFNLVLSRLVPGAVGAGFGDAFVDVDDAIGTGDLGAIFGSTFLFGILSWLITLVVGAAVVALVLQLDRGRENDIGVAIRDAMGVLWPVLAATVLLGFGAFAAFFGFVLLAVLVSVAIPILGLVLAFLVFLPAGIIGGLALLGLINLVVPIAVVERQGPIDTITRAWWVLRRRFWRVVGITALIGLLVGVVTIAVSLPFTIASAFAGGFGWVLESVGSVAAQIASVPLTSFAALLLYLDARARFEGLDLQLRQQQLGNP